MAPAPLQRFACVLLVAALALTVFVGAGAADGPLRVCATGCSYTTLAGALAAAQDGDKIFIDAGSFAGGVTITKSVSLKGDGPSATTIGLSGTFGAGSVVTIASGASVTISDVSISGGFAQLGAGVRNEGTLTLRDSAIRENNGFGFGSAGSIYNSVLGSLTLINTTVSDNIVVDGVGGGIYNRGAAVLTASSVTGNGAEFVGAGLFNDLGATLTLLDSVVSDNSSGLAAGGIENRGSLTIRTSSISGNSAQTFGGGILNEGLLELSGSSISANTAAWGGGLYNGGDATLRDSAVSGNTAYVEGGGIYDTGVLNLLGTSVSGNFPDDCFGC
jgi:hypothetical protein